MSSGLLSIGLSGLNAAQAGMTTTSENIANVNTTGYSEESVIQSEASPVFSGGGYLGTGVDVDTVTRAYSAYQQQQVVQATASSGELSTQYNQMSQIDNLLGDPTTGISAAVDSFLYQRTNAGRYAIGQFGAHRIPESGADHGGHLQQCRKPAHVIVSVD